jgi:hypothetical protein
MIRENCVFFFVLVKKSWPLPNPLGIDNYPFFGKTKKEQAGQEKKKK